MDYEQFVSSVQDALAIDRLSAERAVAATLNTLADRLTREQARKLVALLPSEIGPQLFTGTPTAEAFDVDEFLERVARRAGLDVPTARRQADVVLVAFARAVGPDEFDRIAATLPKDYAQLLPRGPAIEPPSMDTVVDDVASHADLDRDAARRAIDAVLVTLAEHIAPGEVDDLIVRLPVELHAVLKAAKSRNPGHATHVSMEQFLAEVAEREGTTFLDAERHARAVLTELRRALGDEEFFDVTVQLPPEYARLWLVGR
jgi:uncharacterized protein (DUF2267 family)